jgi:hypothetical protein
MHVNVSLKYLPKAGGGVRGSDTGGYFDVDECTELLVIRRHNPDKICKDPRNATLRESLRQVERAQGEVRKPKCQRTEG